MKKYILYTLLFAGLVASCNTEQLPDSYGKDNYADKSLKLDIKRADFLAASETGSRVTNSGLVTTFSEGDVIGVLVTQDGVNYNLPYKYDGTNWIFDTTKGKDLFVKTTEGALDYIIYYPYTEKANGVTTVEGLKTALPVLEDQSSEANYTASDVLYATVNSAENEISGTLGHLRSLFAFRTKVKFQTTVSAADEFETYDIQLQDIDFAINGNEINCNVSIDGEYRYIIDSDKTISWVYGYKENVYERSKEMNSIASGTKYTTTEIINIGTYNEAVANVGDYYCSSAENRGYLLPKEFDISSSKHTCIGIVFHLGAGNGDSQDVYSGTNIATNGIKGYVVALNDADNLQWMVSGKTVNESISKSSDTWDGYKNTQTVKSTLSDYPAFEKCISWTSSVDNKTSGWYLPSYAQLIEFHKKYDSLKSSFDNVKGLSLNSSKYYWVSTRGEKNEEAVIIWNGEIYVYGMNNTCSVRPVLTF